MLPSNSISPGNESVVDQLTNAPIANDSSIEMQGSQDMSGASPSLVMEDAVVSIPTQQDYGTYLAASTPVVAEENARQHGDDTHPDVPPPIAIEGDNAAVEDDIPSAAVPQTDQVAVRGRQCPHTRFQAGARKPKVYNDGTVCYGYLASTSEPQCLEEALKEKHWKLALDAEYNALMKNKT